MVVLPPPLPTDCFSFEFFHQFPFQKYAANLTTILFLGESRHSELIGPRFQRPILKKKDGWAEFFYFLKKCIFTILFLGESRHSELIGPPF